MSSKGYELVQLAKSLVVDANGTITDLDIDTTNIEELVNIDLAIAPEILEIQVAAPAAGQATTWLWTWEQSTLPYARRTITNSPELSVPLYLQGTYTVNNFAAYDLFDQMTQTHSLYLKWIDGAGTDNLVSWATSTGPVSDTHPDINGGNATDVQRISISVPNSITLPTLTAPSVSYTVTNNGAGAYTFSGAAKGDNPNLGPFYRGGTYTINITATGHPFYFTTDNGTNFSSGTYFGEYTDGVTGSRTDSGTITFTVPNDAPDTLYYQCGNHSAMRGAITIKDLAVETNINGNYVVYFQHTQEGHKTPVELRPIPSLVNQMCIVYDASVGKFVPQDLATYVENTPSFENKIREVAGTAELVVEDGSAVVAKVNVYADSTYLPLVGNNAGDQAFATDTNKLYIWDGSAWQLAGAANTGELPEGTNLYYTDARVDARLASGNVGDLVVGGNLTVNGTTTTINSATLTVDDKNIVLASGAADAATADGAGITIDGANATITYDGTNDEWDFNKNINITGRIATTGGVSSFDNVVRIEDNVNDTRVQFRRSDTGANAWIGIPAWDTDSLKIYGPTATSDELAATYGSSAWTFRYGGDVRLTTTSSGIDVTGGIIFGDNHAIVSDVNDNLTIESSSSEDVVIKSGSGVIEFRDSGQSGSPLRMKIDTDGNVGIGTDTPDTKLQINKSGSNTIGEGHIGLGGSSTSLWAIRLDNSDANFTIDRAYGGWTSTPALYIRRANGKVGINKNDASHTLDVNGDINAVNSFRTDEIRHSIRPTLNLDFANSKQLDSRITFYRDSIATYYDSKGVLRYANVNEPRFDHDPATGESKGLLIEESRTNLNTASENFSAWSAPAAPTACLIELNSTVSPDGNFSAAKVDFIASDNHPAYNQVSVSFANGAEMTNSLFVKYGGGNLTTYKLQTFSSGTSNLDGYAVITFNGSGVITSVTTETNVTSVGYEDVGNGWYRVYAVQENTTGGTQTTMRISIGRGASDTGFIYIWGAQIETGAFPTSYIPSSTRFISRSSAATYHDENGVIKSVGVNVPRYGYKYDGRKWVETGLILEQESTNSIQNFFSNAGALQWSSNQNSEPVATSSVTAPDGSTTAFKQEINSVANAIHSIYDYGSVPVGQQLCFSVYAKAAEYDRIYLYTDGIAPTIGGMWYDLSAGTVAAGPNNDVDGYGIENVGNGWYRCWFSGTPTSNATAYFHIDIAQSDNGRTFVGTVGEGVYLWGPQREYSASPSSYIYTDTGNVTRSADVASSVAYTRERDYAIGYDVDSLMEVNKGDIDFTLYGDIQGIAHNGGFQQAIYLEDTSDSGNMYAVLFSAYAGNNTIASSYNINGVARNFGNWTSTESDISLRWKIAMGIEENNSRASANGVLGSSAAGYWSGGGTFDRFYIGNGYQGARPFNGHIRKISYYPERLSNDELIALTENN